MQHKHEICFETKVEQNFNGIKHDFIATIKNTGSYVKKKTSH